MENVMISSIIFDIYKNNVIFAMNNETNENQIYCHSHCYYSRNYYCH